MPAPSALKLLSSRLYVGAACTNKLCSCHSLSQGFCLPVLKKQFQRQYVLESSIKKRISSQRAETPVLHLLRRVPAGLAPCRMCIPGAGASSLVGVNRQVRNNWDECDGKERWIEGWTKFMANWGTCGIHLKPSSVLLPYKKAWHKCVV